MLTANQIGLYLPLKGHGAMLRSHPQPARFLFLRVAAVTGLLVVFEQFFQVGIARET